MKHFIERIKNLFTPLSSPYQGGIWLDLKALPIENDKWYHISGTYKINSEGDLSIDELTLFKFDTLQQTNKAKKGLKEHYKFQN